MDPTLYRLKGNVIIGRNEYRGPAHGNLSCDGLTDAEIESLLACGVVERVEPMPVGAAEPQADAAPAAPQPKHIRKHRGQ